MAEQTQRLMEQCLADTSVRRAKLYGLALLRTIHDYRANSHALSIGKDKKGYIQAFRSLYQDYAFAFTDESHRYFHIEIRDCLRLHLLEHRHTPDVDKLVIKIYENQQKQLHDVEQTQSYPDLRTRLCDETWVETFLDVLEAQFWVNPSAAVTYAISFLLAASLYHPHLIYEIADMSLFFLDKIELSQRTSWSEICQSFNLLDSSLQPREKLKILSDLKERIAQGKRPIPPPFDSYSQQLIAALWWQKGELYRELNQLYEALNHYTKALPSLYSEEQLPTYMARLYYVLAEKVSDSDDQLQIEFLSKTIEHQPDFKDAHYKLGNIYFDQKRYHLARSYYQYAIELQPHDAEAWINLGVVHVKLREYQRALDELNYAEQLDRTIPQLFFLRGNVYRELKTYTEALRDFDKAIELHPTFAEAYTNRGNIYAMLNQPERAGQDYEQTIILQPDDMQALWLQEWIHFGRQRITQTEAVAQRLLKIAACNPDHYLATVCTGIAQGLTQKYIKQALPELERGCQKAPDQWDAYFWLAMLAAYCNHFKQAEAALYNAVKLGVPTALLSPLYWLEKDRKDFFQSCVRPLLQKYTL